MNSIFYGADGFYVGATPQTGRDYNGFDYTQIAAAVRTQQHRRVGPYVTSRIGEKKDEKVVLWMEN